MGGERLENQDDLLERILSGQSDSSIPFEPLLVFLESLGLERFHQGTHNWFTKDGIDEPLDVRLPPGEMTRPTDVMRARVFIEKYKRELLG